MSETQSKQLPRYDFYQTDSHVIVALYIKGYSSPGVMERVGTAFHPDNVILHLPQLGEGTSGTENMEVGPLFAGIKPEESTSRILSTKIELKLSKASPGNWTSLLKPNSDPPSTNDTSSAPAASGSILDKVGMATHRPLAGGPGKLQGKKPNWDKVVEKELQEDEKADSADPNAGGDSALQKMFSQIYAGADEDTRRAMIKSFTESGGTTLSTDWSTIGKEKTPIRPPDGMEARKM